MNLKKLSTLLILSATSLTFAGCASRAQIQSDLAGSQSADSISAICFDIGTGLNSNGIQDDYWQYLNVDDPTVCTEEVVKLQTRLNEQQKAELAANSLAISLKKDFITAEERKRAQQTYASYKNKAEQLKAQQFEEYRQRTIELCGKNGLSLGDSQACLYHVKGRPDARNRSVNSTGVHIQHVYRYGSKSVYYYTENGIITSYQD